MLAQVDFGAVEKQIPNFKFAGGDLGQIVSDALPYFFGAAGILLLLYLVWGGLGLMLSRGDPKAVQAARDKITGALIGFVIVFTAFWLTRIIADILGLEPIKNIFK